MRDEPPEDSRRATGRTDTRRRILASIAIVMLIGAAAAAVGAGGSTPSDGADESTHEDDQLVVTDTCVDEGGLVAVENPTDETVDVELDWESDGESLSVRSDGVLPTRLSTESTVESTPDGTRGVTVHTLGTAVPADEGVAFVGLQDGPYELSATVDDADVELNRTAVTLDCDADDDGAKILLTPVDDSPIEADDAATESDESTA